MDAAAVERYFDERLGPAVEERRVPGAVVAVATAEGPLLVKAWGASDLESGAGADPQTLFRIGSVTKVFTAIAALQMMDEGLIELDKNVNDYFDLFEVETVGDRPLTLRQLLSHQGGFDSYVGNMNTGRAPEAMSAAQMKRELISARPPGEVSSYDNMGVGLLGVVLAHIDGKPYPELIRDRVLEPLGMNHTAVGLPDAVAGAASRCHEFVSGEGWTTCQHELLRDLAKSSGDISATAADMARFLTMLLNRGELDGERVLSEARFAELIDTDLNRVHPRLRGMGRIVQEVGRVGYGAYGHSGGIRGFLSQLSVSPADGVAVFMSINGTPHSPAGFWESLTYSPGEDFGTVGRTVSSLLSAPTDLFAEVGGMSEFSEVGLKGRSAGERLDAMEVRAFAGAYRPLRALDMSSFPSRVLTYLSPPVEVAVAGEAGQLRIDGAGPYRQSDPRLFEHGSPDDRVTFIEAGGRHYLIRNIVAPLQKMRWFENAYVLVWPLVVLAVTLLFVGVGFCRGEQKPRRFGAMVSAGVVLGLLCIGLELTYGATLAARPGLATLSWLWRFPLIVLCAALFVAAWRTLSALAERSGSGVVPPDGRLALSAAKGWQLFVVGAASALLLVVAGLWTLIVSGLL